MFGLLFPRKVSWGVTGLAVSLFFAQAALGEGERPRRVFGEAPSVELALTPIGEIVSDPEAWEGKRVKIAGAVSGVCSRKGCWIDIVSDDRASLRVKVEDDVIVFPRDAVGLGAEAEGVVELLEMERDRYEAWIRHVADEEGREFDPAEIGDGPYRIVRLKGTGASIDGL